MARFEYGSVCRNGSGKWAYELELTVPRSLRIVAGVPIALRDFSVTVGNKDWLATTGCPGGAQRSSAEVLPSRWRAMMRSWICCVPSKMSRIFASRAHFSSSSSSP
jgi:hypothetical protein